MSKYVTRKLTEDEMELINYCDGGDEFKIIDAGEWGVDGKYQFKTLIFKENASGKLYSWNESRTGSYHTDYHYESDDFAYEVTAEERMVVEVTYKNVLA